MKTTRTDSPVSNPFTSALALGALEAAHGGTSEYDYSAAEYGASGASEWSFAESAMPSYEVPDTSMMQTSPSIEGVPTVEQSSLYDRAPELDQMEAMYRQFGEGAEPLPVDNAGLFTNMMETADPEAVSLFQLRADQADALGRLGLAPGMYAGELRGSDLHLQNFSNAGVVPVADLGTYASFAAQGPVRSVIGGRGAF